MIKMNATHRTILNFISFNVGWWACAVGASKGIPLLGPALMPIWVGLHLYFAPNWKGEAVFLTLLGGIGYAIDTWLLRVGLFSTANLETTAPAWLVSMWILFGITFESMLPLRRNIALLLVAGALSGPLSYYCGEALRVLFYRRPLWISLIEHGALWSLLMPALFRLRDFVLARFRARAIYHYHLQAEESHRQEAGPQEVVAHSHLAKPSDPDKF